MSEVDIRVGSRTLGDVSVSIDARRSHMDPALEREEIASQLEEAARRIRFAYQISTPATPNEATNE